MSKPTRVIPSAQVQTFGRAICERVGIDPEMVGERFHWEVMDGEKYGRVDLTIYLPAEELLDMFNAAGRTVD